MKKAQGAPHALPVASVDSVAQAKAVFVRFGRLQYDGGYAWTDFSGNVEDLEAVGQKIEEFYQEWAK